MSKYMVIQENGTETEHESFQQAVDYVMQLVSDYTAATNVPNEDIGIELQPARGSEYSHTLRVVDWHWRDGVVEPTETLLSVYMKKLVEYPYTLHIRRYSRLPFTSDTLISERKVEFETWEEAKYRRDAIVAAAIRDATAAENKDYMLTQTESGDRQIVIAYQRVYMSVDIEEENEDA